MKLLLERQPSHLTCTLGSLYVNDEFECFTLEDVVREIEGRPVSEWKIHGQTAIPAGEYFVTLENSPRFGVGTLTINAEAAAIARGLGLVPRIVGVRVAVRALGIGVTVDAIQRDHAARVLERRCADEHGRELCADGHQCRRHRCCAHDHDQEQLGDEPLWQDDGSHGN